MRREVEEADEHRVGDPIARPRDDARSRDAAGAPLRDDGRDPGLRDSAPIVALRSLAGSLPDDVALRLIERLDIDDLLAVPAGAGVVVVDAVEGIDPGWVVQIPFSGLIGRESGFVLRASHALSVPGTIGLASMIHGRPMVGVVVAIGGACFGLGDALSWPVIAAMGSYRLAIADAVDRVRLQALAGARANA
jgi:hypothetical protein